jgi:hypothetical protein
MEQSPEGLEGPALSQAPWVWQPAGFNHHRLTDSSRASSLLSRAQIHENHGFHFHTPIKFMNDIPPSDKPPLPDHLSVDPKSPHHVAAVFEYDVGIRFNDKERFDVEEYCISEGWVKVPAGKTVDRRGRPLTIKLKGRVEVFYK